jgi:hypothetical protein
MSRKEWRVAQKRGRKLLVSVGCFVPEYHDDCEEFPSYHDEAALIEMPSAKLEIIAVGNYKGSYFAILEGGVIIRIPILVHDEILRVHAEDPE